jgi:hypothetical protein
MGMLAVRVVIPDPSRATPRSFSCSQAKWLCRNPTYPPEVAVKVPLNFSFQTLEAGGAAAGGTVVVNERPDWLT